MKTSVIFSCLLWATIGYAADVSQLVAPQCSSALQCGDPELVAQQKSGTGLVVRFVSQSNGATAVLEELTVVKDARTRTYKTLTEVPCHRVERAPDPDSAQTVVVCEDPDLADAGYRIELLSADFAGVHRARVFEQKFTGATELSRIPCGR